MNNVEIVCVIDQSGSMNHIRNDSIGGFNSFLENQKALPGEAKFTLVLFSDQYNLINYRINLKEAVELTDKTYAPNGSTALYDAIGKTMNKLGNDFSLEQIKPEKVIFVILTDGEENASKEFTQPKIAEMIKHQTDNYGWEFIFLAANQDAFATGMSLNINPLNTANFQPTARGTAIAYSDMNIRTTAYRA